MNKQNWKRSTLWKRKLQTTVQRVLLRDAEFIFSHGLGIVKAGNLKWFAKVYA